ncbi:hypothetical protein BE21_31715 [Sorangium cellulosum]|uniref:Uncharacterized protein n=2 Tax=Sorangium cellulosum TaxID=56 RepID=A0A150TQJ8_SORCE|nr:hypothetical protein BE21_31715 [Sorangium cellulosum]
MPAPGSVVSASSRSLDSAGSRSSARPEDGFARSGSLGGSRRSRPLAELGTTEGDDRGSPRSDADCLLFMRQDLQTNGSDGRISRPTPIST